MNLAGFLIKSRGVPSLAKRIPGLFMRFGVTDGKIATCLHSFVDITERYNAWPTFAITANLVSRYPKLIRGLQDRGVEFAIHGLVHTNYAQLSLDEQRSHIARAMQIFDDNGIEFSGFRCPYLSSNSDTLRAVADLGLKWESSDVISWDTLDLTRYSQRQLEAYKKITDIYQAKSIASEKSVPKMINGLVEIPVSIPDDEILVDRLHIKDRSQIALIWLEVLEKSHKRGELFTIQLHHERIDFCDTALIQVLERARSLQPSIWTTQLRDISDWVRELRGIVLALDQLDENRFRVRVEGSERATVLIKNADVGTAGKGLMDGYRLVSKSEFELCSSTRPVIGVAPSVPYQTVKQLRDEGFMVEVSTTPGTYSIYLNDTHGIQNDSLITAIEESGKPVIRLWRWPYGARSALSCTGDIDSITLIDFARRFVEV